MKLFRATWLDVTRLALPIILLASCGSDESDQSAAPPPGIVTVTIDGNMVEYRNASVSLLVPKGVAVTANAANPPGGYLHIEGLPGQCHAILKDGILTDGSDISNSDREGGSCSVMLTDDGSTSGSVAGTFIATVVDGMQRKKVLTNGAFSLPMKK